MYGFGLGYGRGGENESGRSGEKKRDDWDLNVLPRDLGLVFFVVDTSARRAFVCEPEAEVRGRAVLVSVMRVGGVDLR